MNEAQDVHIGGLRDRFLVLRALDTLAPLDDAVIAMLAEHARPRRFSAGEVVLAADTPVSGVHAILSGQVEVRRNGVSVLTLGRGDGLGIHWLLSPEPGGLEAVAVAATRTLEVSAAVMLDAVEQEPTLMRNALRMAARSLLEQRGGLPLSPDRQPPVDPGQPLARPRTFVERLIALREVPLFAHANLDAMIEFVRRSGQVRGRAGDRLWTPGDPSDHWLTVAWGKFRCTSTDGREVFVGAGFSLGVMDSLADLPRAYGVVAETDWGGYRADLEAVLSLFDTHVALARAFQAQIVALTLGGPS